MLLAPCKHLRVKLHRLSHVQQKVVQAMVSRIGVIFMLYALSRELSIQGGSSLLEAVIVILTAVEIDRQIAHSDLILLCEPEWIVRLPVGDDDRIAEDQAQRPDHGRSRLGGCVYLLRRFEDQCRALCAY